MGPLISKAWLVVGVLFLSAPFRAQAATNVTVTGLTAIDKVYDATTTATISGNVELSGVSPDDDVTVAGAPQGAFNDKNVGDAKPVTVSGLSLSGSDAGNYSLVPPLLQASIMPSSLLVSGLIANDKVYDATIAATVSGSTAVSSLPGDEVTVKGNPEGAFNSKNVGDAKSVTVSGLYLDGPDAGNYSLVPPALQASITPGDLVVVGLVALDKECDGTTAASLAGTASVTALASDVVTVSGSAAGTFDDFKVGADKLVTVTGLFLTGEDASNYELVPPVLSASITAASSGDICGLFLFRDGFE